MRTVPDALARRYVDEGWWTDESLGAVAASGLAAMSGAGFRVYSQVRPWSGTFADVDRAARALAASLRARGVGAGDVVVCQLPNWVEAGITFWAAAYLGAVMVPIVHFYGAKEVEYILRVTEPEVIVSADRFGHADHHALYGGLLGDGAGDDRPLWLVASDAGEAALPARAKSFASLLDSDPIGSPAQVDPGMKATAGTLGRHPLTQDVGAAVALGDQVGVRTDRPNRHSLNAASSFSSSASSNG